MLGTVVNRGNSASLGKMAPERYAGDREGLKPFLTSMNLYARFNGNTFP